MSTNRFRRFGSGLNTLFESFAAARRASAAYSRLSAMSDAQLARRGIARTDIPGLVSRELNGG